MEVAGNDVYTEDISLLGFSPAQYLSIVQKTIASLYWPLTNMTDTSVGCLSINNGIPGEYITINIQDGKARLHSRPIDEYYYHDEQIAGNIQKLHQAIAKTIEEIRIADRNLHPMHREKYGALLPSKSYKVTPILIYINTFMLLIMALAGISLLHPTAKELYNWGGNFRPAVMQGQWWRLITYMFLHAGFMHMAMNAFGLLYIGMFLEPLIGKLRFASAYLLTGIFAGLTSIAIHATSVGVGASGAIFGMYGVFLALLTTNYLKRTNRKTLLRSMLFFVVLNLMYGLRGDVDNAAHIGGLVSGFIIGYAFYPRIKRQAELR